MCGSNMLLSYLYSTSKFQIVFLVEDIVADKESLANIVRLNAPSHAGERCCPTYPGFSASKHGPAAARPGRTAFPHPQCPLWGLLRPRLERQMKLGEVKPTCAFVASNKKSVLPSIKSNEDDAKCKTKRK